MVPPKSPGAREALVLSLKEWPPQPGVYIMRDAQGKILYVGKAKHLRNRVRSYFQKAEGLSAKTQVLVRKIQTLEFTVTNNELEALLLECNLIKQHRPRYNIRLKDDKNFPYFKLDFSHPFPSFDITRKVVPEPKVRYFGPYGAGVRDISRFLLKTFQIRDCSDSKFANRKRPCLSYEIGTCTAPCVDYVTQENYAKQVRDAVLFLNGRKRELSASLKREMDEASSAMEYEKARIVRDKLYALEKITAKQDMVLGERKKDIDVLGAYVGENEVQWILLFIRGGYLTGRRAFRVSLGVDSVEEALPSFLQQVYSKALVPDEIWVASDFPDRAALQAVLEKGAEKRVLIRVGRNEKSLRLLGMAQENAKLLYLDSRKDRPQSAGEALSAALDLAEPPFTVEGIDISNLQADAPVGSLVHFEDGVPVKSRYRLYYPKTVEGQNDFAMIREVVLRRFRDAENPRPDLLLIDGGKGQLGAALSALKELEIDQPICSLAKARTESAFTRKEVSRSDERIFLPGRKNPVVLRQGDPALALLARVRDEAHRFGVKNHRRRRDKNSLEGSPLQALRGIGPKTKERLLKEFGTLEAVLAASDDALRALGLTRPQIEAVRKLSPAPRPEAS